MNKNQFGRIFDELFPVNRSILGIGYRKSLKIIQKYIPFNIIRFKSGEKVFDWKIPLEWSIVEGYLLSPDRKKIIDYKENNLHVISYSDSIKKTIGLDELKKHLYTQKDLENAIPYITSYYKKNWGFGIAYKHYKKLEEGNYTVTINSNFKKGTLEVGEKILYGRRKNEILISTYLCHPSMANNELSGPLVMIDLYHKIKSLKKRQFSYRFVINPETIGSIAYISKKEKELKKNILGGIVLTCLGGPSKKLSYKLSKNSNSIIDRLFKNTSDIRIREFTPFGGSDERQYNSPGIDLKIGQIARTVYQEYPEYHTSLDDKNFMKIDKVIDSSNQIMNLINDLENQTFYINLKPKCEPQLGRRNLYPNINSKLTREEKSNDNLIDGREFNKFSMILLNYSDGTYSLEDLVSKFKIDMNTANAVAQVLEKNKLIKKL